VKKEQPVKQDLDPSHIMHTSTAFWASKVLLTAIEFDLFSTLGAGAMTATEPGEALGIRRRARNDFFDALVALGFLQREGDGEAGRYRNTPETDAFLNKTSEDYLGGLPAMPVMPWALRDWQSVSRLYPATSFPIACRGPT
jgi:hypothetical protein